MLNLFGSLGAGFGIGGYNVGSMNEYHGGGGSSIKNTTDHYINLGQGLKVEAGAGYMAMPDVEMRFSVDVNIGLFAPTTGDKYSPDPGSIEVKNRYYSWGVKIMAVPQFEVLEMFDMYVGAGLGLNFAGSSYDSTWAAGGTEFKTTYNREFSPALGFSGIAGVIIPFSDEISLYGELQFEAASFTLNKLKLKDYSPKIPTFTPTDKVYEKDDNADNNTPPKYPGSNWSIRAGVKIWVM
jgi:opacity protein-like surface antigen